MVFTHALLSYKRKQSFYILHFILCILSFYSTAQESYSVEKKLNWTPKNFYLIDNKKVIVDVFENAGIDFLDRPVPFYHETFFAEKDISMEFSITDTCFVTADSGTLINHERPFFYVHSTFYAGQNVYDLVINPFRLNPETHLPEKLVSFKINIVRKYTPAERSIKNKPYRNVTQSVMAEGKWYKLKVKESGIYKIDYNYLKNMGINPSQINPKNIKIYGFGGGMLPMPSALPRPDDLIENAIFVAGQEDNVFDNQDFILFYGESPHTWVYDSASHFFSHVFNYYSDNTCYFLVISDGEGLRINETPSLNETPEYYVSDYIWHGFHEKVMRTEINDYVKSGRDWFGEELKTSSSLNISFNVPSINKSFPVVFTSYVAGRSSYNSTFSINIHNKTFTQNIFPVNTGDYLSNYCGIAVNKFSFIPVKDELDFNIIYNKPNSNAIGWLNYLSVNARAGLKLNSGQITFRDTLPFQKVSEIQISSTANDIYLWDITEKCKPSKQQKFKNGNLFTFRIKPDKIHEFAACVPGSELIPDFAGEVPNQNLHGVANVDMVIITYPDYMPQAVRLAKFREKNDSLTVYITTPQLIYNEFSSGSQDITAIRDFLKHIYQNNTIPEKQLKYVLLLGDASYDYRDVLTGNTNRIPTYQNMICYSPISSYASDDFYGFLDDNEGNFDDIYASWNDKMDIAIGRLPVSSVQQAEDVVKKIIHYDDILSKGDWRNRILFVSDDVDDGGFNAHIEHSEYLAKYLQENVKNLNINKIYMDAYQQVSSSNGHKYPDAQQAINDNIEKGTLVVNYIGHGGEVGWAHERVLEISDIKSWKNIDKLSVFITATCEFSRYDDPGRISAGELVLLNPNGGGAALLSTSRVVYVQANETLTSNLYKNNMFERKNGKHKRLGDILIETKNRTGFSDNTRKFLLLGDPSMKLAFPDYVVKPLNVPDTFKALDKITINGQIEDIQGRKLTNFKGKVFTTVFDKASTFKTLDNDHYNKVVTFTLINNTIFYGSSSVDSGSFSFSFIIPKDISYAEGFGKISFYATDNLIDANGYYDNFIVGGTSDSVNNDYSGPSVRVFIGDTNFISGGITGENPLLYVIVKDPSGINTIGNGIGHEILGFIDNENPVVLNPYYRSKLNSFTEGEIYYQLKNLSEGEHTIVVKVWDVYNNSASGSVEFVVKSTNEPVISNVFGFPNPFSESTVISFEHNQDNQEFDINIDIFTTQGQKIRSIEKHFSTNSPRLTAIEWKPYNDFGQAIESGIYIISIVLTTKDGKTATGRCKTIFVNDNN